MMIDLNTILDYYGNKNVAVVGGAGMIGSKLVEQLISYGARVIVLDNFSRGRTINDNAEYIVGTKQATSELMAGWKMLQAGFPHFRPISIDAGRPDWYWKWFRNVDVVFNLAAAVAGVLHNERHHLQMYQDNINVLAGPLRAAMLASVPAYLQTSSVCVYAEHYQCPSCEIFGFEDEPHPANAGYAEAKRDGERLVAWSSIPRTIVVRPSNVAGERDYFDDLAHVIPAFIKRAVQLTEGETFTAYGNSQVQREFIYSADAAFGMAYAMAVGKSGEAYNIGTSGGQGDMQNVLTMLTLARKIISEVNLQLGREWEETRIVFDNSRGGGDSVRYSDSSKLRGLGWRHMVGIDEIISREVSYYLRVILGRVDG